VAVKEVVMGGLSWWHWLIIIAALVLIFGAKKLPDAARGIGRSMRILKSEVNAMHEDDAGRPSDGPQTAGGASAATAPGTPAIAPTPPDAASFLAAPAPAPAPVAAPAPAPATPPAAVQATTIDGKPAVIINGVPTLIDNQAT
jgi:sec-independent protein translocase protein TatA